MRRRQSKVRKRTSPAPVRWFGFGKAALAQACIEDTLTALASYTATQAPPRIAGAPRRSGPPAPVSGPRQRPPAGRRHRSKADRRRQQEVHTFDKANAKAPSTRTTQYFDMVANRGIYHDGWYACTTPPVPPWLLGAAMPPPEDYKWKLHKITDDYSQANDLAAQMPEKLTDMQARFDEEAKKFNVYRTISSLSPARRRGAGRRAKSRTRSASCASASSRRACASRAMTN